LFIVILFHIIIQLRVSTGSHEPCALGQAVLDFKAAILCQVTHIATSLVMYSHVEKLASQIRSRIEYLIPSNSIIVLQCLVNTLK